MPRSIQCPNCNGVISCDLTVTRITCAHCGSVFDIGNAPEPHQSTASYSCPSCAARIIASNTELTSTCPFCGNNLVLTDRFDDAAVPTKLVPFRIGQDDLQQHLDEFLSPLFYAPKAFRPRAGEFSPVYIPYHVYNVNVEGRASVLCLAATGNDSLDRDSRIYSMDAFETAMMKGETFTGNDALDAPYVDVTEQADALYCNIAVDGSTKMPDEFMSGIVPFNIDRALPFHDVFVAGQSAEAADNDENCCRADAIAIAKRCFERQLAREALYEPECGDLVRVSNLHADCEIASHELIALPVWLARIEYDGETQFMAVNGQTGRVSAKVPLDSRKRTAFIVAIITALIAATVLCASLSATVFAALFPLMVICAWLAVCYDGVWKDRLDGTVRPHESLWWSLNDNGYGDMRAEAVEKRRFNPHAQRRAERRNSS